MKKANGDNRAACPGKFDDSIKSGATRPGLRRERMRLVYGACTELEVAGSCCAQEPKEIIFSAAR